jgi:hypothetical protein
VSVYAFRFTPVPCCVLRGGEALLLGNSDRPFPASLLPFPPDIFGCDGGSDCTVVAFATGSDINGSMALPLPLMSGFKIVALDLLPESVPC